VEKVMKSWHWRIGVAGIQIAVPRKALVDINVENRTTSTGATDEDGSTKGGESFGRD
jgi:hypothetical protein